MKKPAYRAVWIELLLEANHESRDILWKGERITIKPGQLTCGLKQLSEWTGVPRGTCKRILDLFKSETMIEIQTSNQFSLITVKNWEQYQSTETQNETTMKRQRNASETPVKTPKECKNVRIKELKKENHINFLLNIPAEVIAEFSKEFNVYEQGIRGKGKDLYNYCKAKGKQYKDYKAFMRNALKRDFGERKPEDIELQERIKATQMKSNQSSTFAKNLADKMKM